MHAHLHLLSRFALCRVLCLVCLTLISPSSRASPAAVDTPEATATLDLNLTNNATEGLSAPLDTNSPFPRVLTETPPVSTTDLPSTLLELARQQLNSKNTAQAAKTLNQLLLDGPPGEIKRAALLELALVAQQDNSFARAQQIYSQYLSRFPDDPSIPEILLLQGKLYRRMGVTSLALAKFYAVMTTALTLKLDRLAEYKKLVLAAQMEIADTYYLDGQFLQAAEFSSRLLKLDSPGLDKPAVLFKLSRSLAAIGKHSEAIAAADQLAREYPNAPDVPEVRFLAANALKQLGRNHEAMQQIILLLDSQQTNSPANPDSWTSWKQRAGNDIANQLYRDGDYMNALAVYLSLANLDSSPAWQLPVFYQIGLVYEHLQFPSKAVEVYDQILSRRSELESIPSPTLLAVLEMASWRREHLQWLLQAGPAMQKFQRPPSGALLHNELAPDPSPKS